MLHATAFSLVRERRLFVPPPPSELEAAPIGIVIDEPAATPAPTSESAASTQPAVATAAMHLRSAQPTSEENSATESLVAPPTDSSMPLVRPLPGTEDDGSWTFRSSRGPLDLKLGDKSASLGRDMAAHGELDLPTPKSAAGVSEALDAIDVKNGFGRAGAVVQIVESAVRDPAAPPEGVAFFDIAIEKSGKISVSVSETTANREDWERLTAAIAASLKTKDVRFPDQGKGLRVGVRVEAKVRYPDGRDPKKNGGYNATNGLKVHTDKNGLVIDELPQVGVGVRGKVCSAQVTIGLLGPSIAGGCEPGNIGTHPERTVAAHETYEQRM